MNTTHVSPRQTDLTATRVLAALLERLDNSVITVDPQQYRSVADRLAHALHVAIPGDDLGALLSAHPAAAEMYENMNYHVAGLCRSPLESSLAAELAATHAIQRAMQ